MELNINTFEQLKEACISRNKQIYEIAQENMAMESDMAVELVRTFAAKSLYAMKEAIQSGMASKELSMSGMCGQDCFKVQKRYKSERAMFGSVFEKIIEYALATSEENIRMGKIVACPTAGSCGILPAALVAVSEEFNHSEREQLNALITAGEIGRIISIKVALAGAVAGCQAECGVASAMSAAAVCQMRGGNVSQILNATALALKNLLGLTCDPVAGLVEVPCVKRNPFLAVHSITAVELALSGVESKIPIDEVIDAMEQTGALMSPTLKESSQAGLATTKTALEVQKQVFG
ncbi:MAG: L-serine ammonia-lyase, iron-sulfur-dependent, subunit alpha [Cyanobacteriota bacterium]|nr:L-serine ammonia-lyase, iron-sulfur-dependent, subunit alpha [Cyanobacteriota bacterium]